MEINTQTQEHITVITIQGELDGKTVPLAQEQIEPLLLAGSKILVDMSDVDYMSSAGLRLVLLLHRKLTQLQGQLVLVGLSEELRDTMSATGFLEYLTTCESLDEGIALFTTG